MYTHTDTHASGFKMQLNQNVNIFVLNLEEHEEEEVCLLQDSITLSNRYIVTTETLQCSPFLFYPPPSLPLSLSLSVSLPLSLLHAVFPSIWCCYVDALGHSAESSHSHNTLCTQLILFSNRSFRK